MEKERFIIDELNRLETLHRRRFLRRLECPGSHKIAYKGQVLTNFSSNDYLGLSEEPRVREAAKRAVDRFAASVGSSRLICGNYPLVEELEEALAAFKGKKTGLVFSSGYLVNIGIIQALVEEHDQIFSDELNHASLIDGIRLSKAKGFIFRHRDLNHLEVLLKTAPPARRRLIVTDAVFSMDGDVVDLPGIASLADRYQCLLMVDEAHATGVLGTEGKGIRQHYVDKGLLSPDKHCIDIEMGTLSKALGSLGGYVVCSAPMRDYLVNKCRSFIFDTALAPAAAGAALEALRILIQEPARLQRLRDNLALIRNQMAERGLAELDSETPILPLILRDELTTMKACEKLMELGHYVQGIRPPSVPPGKSRLRITINSLHLEDEIIRLARDLEFIMQETISCHKTGATQA